MQESRAEVEGCTRSQLLVVDREPTEHGQCIRCVCERERSHKGKARVRNILSGIQESGGPYNVAWSRKVYYCEARWHLTEPILLVRRTKAVNCIHQTSSIFENA